MDQVEPGVADLLETEVDPLEIERDAKIPDRVLDGPPGVARLVLLGMLQDGPAVGVSPKVGRVSPVGTDGRCPGECP